tara:strand:- start:479 stop:751 length:273 start_codon:yes stop_codon:yes gene_type:complete
MEPNKYLDDDLVYEDYLLIINAKSGHWEKRDTKAMKRLQPYFEKEYLQTDRSGAIWLTEKGVRMLQAVGCDPLDPRDFFANYPHMLDMMK